MDGSPQIVDANLVGDTVLILRCKDQTTEPRSPLDDAQETHLAF
jgi:hypothetical protein